MVKCGKVKSIQKATTLHRLSVFVFLNGNSHYSELYKRIILTSLHCNTKHQTTNHKPNNDKNKRKTLNRKKKKETNKKNALNINWPLPSNSL